MARLFRVLLPAPRLAPRPTPDPAPDPVSASALRRLAPPLLALFLSFAAACGGAGDGPGKGKGAGESGDAREAATLLSAVAVAPERITVLGYDRSRFGGWTAAGTASGAGDTRDAVLAEWFSGSPTIADPYTGEDVAADGVDVDHVYPLAAAWDFGAHAWDARARREFANDAALNLVPVTSAVNREKSDLTPAEWLPPARELRCGYSVRYLRVAVAWELPVSVADWTAMAGACGIRAR